QRGISEIEVCDDGIDNDCNGSVDCADPACTDGFECVEPAPDGWAPMVLADDARPSCPEGYTGSTDVSVLQGDGTITCACNCGSDCGATITLTKGTELTCMVTPSTDALQVNASCTGKSWDLPSGFTMATSGNGTCSAKDTPTKSDPTDGRTCTPPQSAAAGCPGAQRCLPKATGFARCVAKAGANKCPAAAFTKQRLSGTFVKDQRACTGCSCDSTPCDVELELWTHPVCQGSAAITITSACAANGSITKLKAYKSKVTGGCTPATPSTPIGTISFEDERTICCN
ncbi:MAG: hypothetical protein J0I07_31455, partial [Myxococcales bacterium]|nr:hypothetical protein [Myxococcales bacterium]